MVIAVVINVQQLHNLQEHKERPALAVPGVME